MVRKRKNFFQNPSGGFFSKRRRKGKKQKGKKKKDLPNLRALNLSDSSHTEIGKRGGAESPERLSFFWSGQDMNRGGFGGGGTPSICCGLLKKKKAAKKKSQRGRVPNC